MRACLIAGFFIAFIKQNNLSFKYMKKNNKQKKEYRYPSNKKEKKKKAQDGDKYQGLNNINQVTGVPKSHAFHSSIPVTPSRTVKEPLPVCPDCNERIQSIAESFSLPNGQYIHFDCMLKRIRSKETLKDNQTISYVGRGNFAVVEKDEEGHYSIVKMIPVEDEKAFSAMKEYVEELKV